MKKILTIGVFLLVTILALSFYGGRQFGYNWAVVESDIILMEQNVDPQTILMFNILMSKGKKSFKEHLSYDISKFFGGNDEEVSIDNNMLDVFDRDAMRS